jgi:hypothetical protein
MNGWDFFNTVEPSLFLLGYNKFPNDIIKNMPCGIPTWLFIQNHLVGLRPQNTPNVNAKWPPQAILDQSNIKDYNGPRIMVSNVTKPLITHCARTKSYIYINRWLFGK